MESMVGISMNNVIRRPINKKSVSEKWCGKTNLSSSLVKIKK